MEEIIKKTIDGGWDAHEAKSFDGVECLNEYEVVCLPNFWTSLGKSCGWGQEKEIYDAEEDENENLIGGRYLKPEIYHAFRFHEINFTEGWDAAIIYLRSVCGLTK